MNCLVGAPLLVEGLPFPLNPAVFSIPTRFAFHMHRLAVFVFAARRYTSYGPVSLSLSLFLSRPI